jgi:hypothetical protein
METFLANRRIPDEIPYLAFLPESGKFIGPILGILHLGGGGFRHFKTEPLENVHRFPAKMSVKWAQLESRLKLSCIYLEQHLQLSYPRRFPYPETSSFRAGHQDRKRIYDEVLRARELFLPLIARLTMDICMVQSRRTPEERRNEHPPKWVDLLSKARDGDEYLPTHFIGEIASSFLVDPSIRRVGGFVNFDPQPRSAWSYLSEYGLNWNVPFVVQLDRGVFENWARSHRFSPSPIFPSKELYDRLILEGKKDLHPTSTHLPPPPSSRVLDRRDAPPPLSGSGQRQGETINDFFIRRKEEEEAIYKKESAKEKERRENREREFCSFPAPTKHISYPRYFEWDLVGDWWVRRYIAPKKAKDEYWGYGSHTDKRYSGIFHEVDISAQFMPSSDDLNPHQPHPQDDFIPDLSWVKQAIPYVEPDEEEESLIDAEDYGMPTEATGNATMELDGCHDVETRLARFYGVNLSLDFQSTQRLRQDWIAAKKSLSIVDDDTCRDEQVRLKIRAYTNGSCIYPFNVDAEKLSDLSPSHPEYLPTRLKDDFRVRLLEQPFKPFHRSANPRQYYQIVPSSAKRKEFYDKAYRIVLESSVATLGALRVLVSDEENVHTVSQLVNYLASHGVTFRTLEYMEGPRSDGMIGDGSTGLGWKMASFCPTLVDWDVYFRLSSYLFQQPRSRALLNAGGILWRLAILFISRDVSINGPSFVHSVVGRDWTYINGFELYPGRYYYDDHAVRSDTDLVCGVYKQFVRTSFILLKY